MHIVSVMGDPFASCLTIITDLVYPLCWKSYLFHEEAVLVTMCHISCLKTAMLVAVCFLHNFQVPYASCGHVCLNTVAKVCVMC